VGCCVALQATFVERLPGDMNSSTAMCRVAWGPIIMGHVRCGSSPQRRHSFVAHTMVHLSIQTARLSSFLGTKRPILLYYYTPVGHLQRQHSVALQGPKILIIIVG
jgi:hypothetical protein